MTNGTLGVIICPMLEDDLMYGLVSDKEEKSLYVVDNEHCDSFKKKLEKKGMKYTLVQEKDLINGDVPMSGYSIVMKFNDLALHAEPKDLMKFVQDEVADMQPYVDAVAVYYGLCGNYGWDITKWAQEKGYKPTEVIRDHTGRVCDDCVGISVDGGENYLNLEKTYTGMFYVIPAIAHNWKPFLAAGDTAKHLKEMDPEILEMMGITDEGSYIKWLFSVCGYKNILKMDTGLSDSKEFDKEFADLAKMMNLQPIVISDGWMSNAPSREIYRRSKAHLAQS